MIWLYDFYLPILKSFNNYEGLCDYFKRREQLSSSYLEKPDSQDQKWDFIYHTHRRFAVLSESLKDRLNEVEWEAYENELDLIDVYTGDISYPEQYIVTSNLNVEVLMKQWVYQYAFAHGFRVLETVLANQDIHNEENISRINPAQGTEFSINQTTWGEGA